VEADNVDLTGFAGFIADSLLRTQEMILEDLRKSPEES